jgi:hypothetical protein
VSAPARRASRSADVRAALGHPVVDADGHFIETGPVFKGFFLDFVRDAGGVEMARRFERAGGRGAASPRRSAGAGG